MAMLPPDPVFIFKGDMSPVSCLLYQITPYFEYLYAGTQSGKVHVWNLKSKREIEKFQSGKESCLSLILFNDDDNVIIAQDKVGMIRFWTKDSNNWVCLKEIQTDYVGFCKCFLSGEDLFVPLKSSQIQLISVKSKEVNDTIELGTREQYGELMALKFVTVLSTRFILVAHESGHLSFWNLDDKEKVSDILFEECPMAIDFDPASMKGVCGNPTENVIVFNIDRNFTFHKQRTIKLRNPGVASIAIRTDHKIVALGCWDGKLRLYSWKNFGILAVLDTHSSTIQDVCFAKSTVDLYEHKYLLAAASKDCKISLWDLYN